MNIINNTYDGITNNNYLTRKKNKYFRIFLSNLLIK